MCFVKSNKWLKQLKKQHYTDKLKASLNSLQASKIKIIDEIWMNYNNGTKYDYWLFVYRQVTTVCVIYSTNKKHTLMQIFSTCKLTLHKPFQKEEIVEV